MNIVVNTQLLLKNRLEGLGWFAYETLKRITRNHPEHTFYFVFDRAYDKDFIFSDNVKPIILKPPSRHPVLWYIRFELLLPLLLKKLKADVYLSPDGWCMLHSKVPFVQVIHDINFEHHPEDLPFLIGKYFRFFFPRYAQKAKRVVTVSEYSRSDIIDTYKIPGDKIDVVYNGCNEQFRPCDEQTNVMTRATYTNGNPYFLFVGALLPRKNIRRMFKAYDKFKAVDKQGVKLVIVGQKKWWTKEIGEVYENMQYKDDVIFLGRLQTDVLAKVFSAAMALTFIPYFEGFGIPIIEAFNCGVPVITSDCTSMPEVASDAALLVNPFTVADITEAMCKISTDPELRQQLISKGHKRKLDFSWDITSLKLWESIEKTLVS